MDDSKTKADAFFHGNGSVHRKHITRYVFKTLIHLPIHDVASRFHYAKYALCKSKNIEAKAHPPADWGKKKSVFLFFFFFHSRSLLTYSKEGRQRPSMVLLLL